MDVLRSLCSENCVAALATPLSADAASTAATPATFARVWSASFSAPLATPLPSCRIAPATSSPPSASVCVSDCRTPNTKYTHNAVLTSLD